MPTLFGRYILLKRLGQGAMGDVHLARPVRHRRGIPSVVVVKRLRGELVNKRAFEARFRHEATIAVSVDSPHVATVYDVGSVGDALYIVMEHVAGWPLSEVLDAVLQSGHHASIASVVDLTAGALRGLVSLHTAKDPRTERPLGIVHRDVSPKNLMVDDNGRPCLIDLGLGRSNIQDWKTRTGAVLGSIGYMPPEQARGERVDQRADVYSMGAVTYELLALRNYIRRGPMAQMMASAVDPHYVEPSRFRSDIPPGLDDVIRVALAREPADRYPSAQAFLRALQSIVPVDQTRGAMKVLLDDLYGAARVDRQRELDALRALPFSDEFDTRPTRVFALSARIGRDHPSNVPTAATELGPRPPDGEPVHVRPVWPDPANTIRRPLLPRWVPTSVLIGAVIIAAALGGALALGLRALFVGPSGAPVEPGPMPRTDPPRRRASPPDAKSRRPAAAQDAATAESPARSVAADGSVSNGSAKSPPPPLVGPTRPRRITQRLTRSPKPEVDGLDAALKQLAKEVDKARGATTGAPRRELTALLVAIRQALASTDPDQKAASLRQLRERLQDLGR